MVRLKCPICNKIIWNMQEKIPINTTNGVKKAHYNCWLEDWSVKDE